MIVIYNILLLLLSPVIAIIVLIISLKRKEINYFFSFWGIKKPLQHESSIFLHGVSAGEVNVVSYIAGELKDKWNIIVSTTSKSGMIMAKRLMPYAHIYYFPFDFYPIMKRFFKKIKPKAAIIAEIEIWPSMIKILSKMNIPSFMVNARLPYKDYKRYRLVKGFISSLLNKYTSIFCRGDSDRSMFISLGVDKTKLKIGGEIKFAIINKSKNKKASIGNNILQRLKGSIIVAGSTHSGEEEIILSAIRNINNISLIIAPRHIKRCNDIIAISKKYGFRSALLSSNNVNDSNVIVVDSMGVLYELYKIADICIVGGSFIKGIGGHNIIEPASLGKAVIVGQYIDNIRDVAEIFVKEKAIIVCKDNLIECIKLINKDIGKRALNIVKRESNLVKETLKYIKDYLGKTIY